MRYDLHITRKGKQIHSRHIIEFSSVKFSKIHRISSYSKATVQLLLYILYPAPNFSDSLFRQPLDRDERFKQ